MRPATVTTTAPMETRIVSKTAKGEPLFSLEEARLIQRVKERDLKAFEELYRLHVGRVYAVCYRIAANAAEAEELTQDVFLRVWEKIDSYEGRSKFSTWLHRLATNRAIDRRRSELRRIQRETSEEHTEVRDAPPPARPGQGVDLERAIAALPTAARTVFVMHDVQGYRHQEIAEMTGMAEGTSKSQLHRARKLLREKLG